MYSIKLSEYRMGIKFDKDPLSLEQNNYLTKIVNVYIVSHSHNIKFKNCLFKATGIVKNSHEETYMYSSYRITFDSAGL